MGSGLFIDASWGGGLRRRAKVRRPRVLGLNQAETPRLPAPSVMEWEIGLFESMTHPVFLTFNRRVPTSGNRVEILGRNRSDPIDQLAH